MNNREKAIKLIEIISKHTGRKTSTVCLYAGASPFLYERLLKPTFVKKKNPIVHDDTIEKLEAYAETQGITVL